ncbi:MAG: hypothetical protein AB7I41_23960 [Candidatus Sericytochromatia bacterium]
MSINALQSPPLVQTTDTTQTSPKPAHKSRTTPARETTPSSLDSADVVEIKKGILPSLKGAGAGALTAGGSTLAIFTVLSGGKPFAGSGGLVSGPLTIAAAVGGAFGGAVSANYTESKSKGALIGGLAGASVGAAAMALLSIKDGPASMLQGALTGALAGGISGAAGGVGGALVAKGK